MTTVFDFNTILIVIALMVGVVVAWWMFKRRGATDRAEVEAESRARIDTAPAPVQRSRTGDTPEGNSLADQGAAATSDIAGQVLGVPIHSELPGASGPPDNLQILKGVGPKLAQRLNELGIIRFDQLARLSANEVDILDAQLGPFRGRIARDRVVEQAAYLARGDTDGFEAQFGNLGSGKL